GFAVSFVLLSRGVPALPPDVSGGDDPSTPHGPLLREILVGLRYAVGRKDLLGSYLADLAAMIFAYPNAMLPFLAVILHAPWSTGLMFAAPSAGALVVSATSGWMARGRPHGLALAFRPAGGGRAGRTSAAASSATRCGSSPSPTTSAAGWPASSCCPTRPARRPANSARARGRPAPPPG